MRPFQTVGTACLAWLAMASTAPAKGRALHAFTPVSIQKADSENVAIVPIRSGHPVLSQAVSLRLDDVPLSEALKAIAAAARVPIAFSPDIIASDRPISLDLTRSQLGKALREALRDSDLAVAVSPGGQVVIIPGGTATLPVAPALAPLGHISVAPPAGTQGTLTGRVSDAITEAPIAGATVVVEGTQQSALTDAGGRYEIAAIPAGTQRVRAVRVGYTEAEQTVDIATGETTTADFALEPQAIALEELVAVGYGTQRRRDLTGSVTSVDVEEARTASFNSVEQVLQGRAAGVQVVQANGAPGGAISVRIRGSNSITAGSEPLYVIDGVPAFVGGGGREAGRTVNPLAALSPNDIESIEILKDASATAIYGSRGGNGVILITTRRGQPGQNSVQFESSVGLQEVSRNIPLLNARQYAELHNEARINAGLEPYFSGDEIAQFSAGTNWQSEIFRPALMQNHGLTVSGGDDRTRYLVSGRFYDQRGIVENTGFRRYSGRLNLDRTVNGRLRIGSNLSLSHTSGEVANTDLGVDGGLITATLQFSPTAPVHDPEGGYVLQNPFVPVSNPVGSVSEITDQRTSSRVMGDLFAEFDLADGLRLRSSIGGNAAFERDEYYAPSTVIEGAGGGSGSLLSSNVSQVVNDNIVTYNRALRDGHELDLTGAFTFQRLRSESLRGSAAQFASDVTGAKDLSAGALPGTPVSGVNEWTLLSWLGRANYNLLDRYLFTITGRYDGSSKFGTNNKWGLFPSVAFAWRLSEEAFLRNASWVSDAKLRLTYGVTGNQEIGTYASLAQLTGENYVLGSQRVSTYAPAGRAPNPELKWETTRQFNVGLDLGLLEDRVVLTADFYTGTTEDLLLRVPLPQTSGFVDQIRNVGSVRNRGVELGVQTVNVDRRGFLWESALTLGVNRNEVVSLGGIDRIFPAGARSTNMTGTVNVIQVGEPLGTFLGYRSDGVWQEGDDVAGSGDPFAAPGEWRYVDVNGDGVIDSNDRTLLGNAQPDFHGGLTNRFSAGPVTLEIFLQGTFGNEVLNGAALFLRSGTFSSNEYASSAERWTPENPSNTMPRANLNRVKRVLDIHVEDGSYLRLQNVALSYRLPNGVIPQVNNAQVYVSGQNLFTWSRYTGYDPEVSSYASDAALSGVDLGMYPRSRTVNVGLNVTF